jgi:hypothetical protein
LLEIVNANPKVSVNEITKVAKYLIEIGADMLAINTKLKRKVKKALDDFALIDLEDKFINIDAEKIDESLIRNLKDLKNKETFKAVIIRDLKKCSPWKMDRYIQQIKNEVNIPVIICPSNIYGMATSIAIEAANAGTKYVITSFSGFGQENGYASLEEVIMGVNLLHGFKKKMNMKNVQELTELFQWILWIKIRINKPIIGSYIFKCESGIHGDGILKSENTYEPYPPEFVGQRREFVIGKHSGKAMVKEKLKLMDLECSDEAIAIILEKIQSLSTSGICIDDKLLIKLVTNLPTSMMEGI